MTEHASVGAPYKVSGYPTIKLFGQDKKKPINFEGGDRTFSRFV